MPGSQAPPSRDQSPSPVEFFEQHVLPRLTIEMVYGEVQFASRRGRYWRAACPLHGGDNPTAFSVDSETLRWRCFSADCGHGSVLAYVNGGRTPRGRDFIEAVRTLAHLAGLDPKQMDRDLSPEERQRFDRRERRSLLLETFVNCTRSALLSEAGARARAYLIEQRGFRPGDLEELELGLYLSPAATQQSLRAAGFSTREIAESEITADDRWSNRLVGAWRDPRGRIATFFARSVDDPSDRAEPGAKYLYLRGSTRPLAFGLDLVLGRRRRASALVLVEGVFDAMLLQVRGIESVAALGGNGSRLTPESWQKLTNLGPSAVTLMLDNDEAGRKTTLTALENAFQIGHAPSVYVVNPTELGSAKDPDELIRAQGIEAFERIYARRIHGYRYYAESIVDKHRPESGWTDPTWHAVMEEAIAFAESVEAPEQRLGLTHFFWPTIFEATDADAEAVKAHVGALRDRRIRTHERRDYEALIREIGQHLKADRIAEAKSALCKRVDQLRLEAQASQIEPVLSVANELSAHAARLERWRGQTFIGLPQRTLESLDRATLGLRGLMLLAAAPNVGKTALAVQLGVDVVTHNPDACFLFVSLEMSRWDIITRIRCRLAQMDWKMLVFGSQTQRGRGREAYYTPAELGRIRQADQRLAAIGDRIRILDERNCPAPSVDTILAHVADLKSRTGATRALMLVDYLQVWPIPEGQGHTIRSDLDADKWRIGAMKSLRDASDDDAVMVISEARKPGGGGMGVSWGGDLSDVMGSARGSYTPDMVFLFRPFDDAELALLRNLEGKGKSLAPKLAQIREQLRLQGKAYNRLTIAKGRDGVLRESLETTFWYRQARFEEGAS